MSGGPTESSTGIPPPKDYGGRVVAGTFLFSILAVAEYARLTYNAPELETIPLLTAAAAAGCLGTAFQKVRGYNAAHDHSSSSGDPEEKPGIIAAVKAIPGIISSATAYPFGLEGPQKHYFSAGLWAVMTAVNLCNPSPSKLSSDTNLDPYVYHTPTPVQKQTDFNPFQIFADPPTATPDLTVPVNDLTVQPLPPLLPTPSPVPDQSINMPRIATHFDSQKQYSIRAVPTQAKMAAYRRF